MSRWNLVTYNGVRMRQIGIMPDGTLYNPNGYPEDDVRAAVIAADARRHERRSQASKDAAVTRRQRTSRRVYVIAKRLTLNDKPVGPRSDCAICGRGLSDQVSIKRGVGSECWQDVMKEIERIKRPVAEHASPSAA